jgi:hypothetical protein
MPPVTVYSFILPLVFGMAARDGLVFFFFLSFLFFLLSPVFDTCRSCSAFLLDVFFNAARVRLFTHVIYLLSVLVARDDNCRS